MTKYNYVNYGVPPFGGGGVLVVIRSNLYRFVYLPNERFNVFSFPSKIQAV